MDLKTELLWAFLNLGPVQKAIENAPKLYLEPLRVEVDGFLLVKVKIGLPTKKTRVKSLYALDCAICESVDGGLNTRSGAYGDLWPRSNDVHLERIDLNLDLPAMPYGAQSELSFLLWVRPPKDAEEIFFVLLSDQTCPVTLRFMSIPKPIPIKHGLRSARPKPASSQPDQRCPKSLESRHALKS